MELRPLDPLDDDAMAAAYTVECATNQKAQPGWVPLGLEARILGWRAVNGWRNNLTGAWSGTTLLGFAAAMTADDTPDVTWVFAWVDPGHQGSGIGSALVRAAEAAAPESTTRFVASASRARPADIQAFSLRFAGPLGYSPATTETVVELDLGQALLPEPEEAGGYTISTYVNGVPEQFRRQVGRIKGLVDAQAPNGDLHWSETPVSLEEYAREIQTWSAQGYTVFESLAVDTDGNVAAWTCLLAAADSGRPAHVEGTLVLTGHRGRRLGTLVKLACLREVAGTGTVHTVRTSSDDQNVWMRSINDQLGFIPVETEIILQKEARSVRLGTAG